ncbi:MAG: transcriptional regulator [Oscillospiraceae bacterium]|nr:transcriptional regulator [Oscillospiraceae bacterium]
MTFADKLNFLMTVTQTSNSALAHSVALDASYISRLRSGKRFMPKDAGVIRSMAAMLARHCSEDYQKKAISDVLKLKNLPGNAAALAGALADWLLHDRTGDAEQVGRFLSGLSGLGSRPAPIHPREDCTLPFPLDDVSVYYGVPGKRRAAEYFLAEVAARETPQTLLLFSDEDTSWMTADPGYAQKWAALMVSVLSRGNKIKIIHTISRDLDEMLNAISQWMPLYMSGLIEPYFYPKKRDGVFKRTLFIAPETAAVVSNSIGDQVSAAANVLYRDRAAVSSFAEEFTRYLRMCRPLMRIFTVREREACYDMLAEFERERADTLITTESLSLLTMPETLLGSMLGRVGLDEAGTLLVHKARRRRFLEHLRLSRFDEIISLPDIEAVKNGGVKVSLSAMLGGGAVCYAPEEYAAHLEHIIALLEAHENYHVHLFDGRSEDRSMVYAREELGVLVAKTSQPPVVLAMSEGNMTAAFWDFLKGTVGEKAYGNPDNNAAAASLREYLKKLCAEGIL